MRFADNVLYLLSFRFFLIDDWHLYRIISHCFLTCRLSSALKSHSRSPRDIRCPSYLAFDRQRVTAISSIRCSFPWNYQLFVAHSRIQIMRLAILNGSTEIITSSLSLDTDTDSDTVYLFINNNKSV